MINRLLYAATAAALISIVMFDENFAANLTHAIGEPIDFMPLDMWELCLAGIHGVLAGAAIYREAADENLAYLGQGAGGRGANRVDTPYDL